MDMEKINDVEFEECLNIDFWWMSKLEIWKSSWIMIKIKRAFNE